MKRLVTAFLVLALLIGVFPLSAEKAQAGSCLSSVGPGIPAPANPPGGIPGFHASWYGQSGYPTLCPGDKATSVVAYYNSGSRGWVAGQMGEVAYLGTWRPSPGQDQPTPLGGDGTNGSPATGWPRYNRIAVQPAPYVGPGQVAWFQFTIQAPQTPGYYKLYLRPLIEGATWMEDYGVFWAVTVLNPDGTYPAPPPQAGCREWPSVLGWMLANLPLPSGLCLLPFQPVPEDWCAPLSGCYVWRTRSAWVKDQTYADRGVGVTAHEICRGHQHRVSLDFGRVPSPYDWEYAPEGTEFKSAWESFKAQYPQAYSDWGDTGNAFDNMPIVCGYWYAPFGSRNTASIPPLAAWAQKWLPK